MDEPDLSMHRATPSRWAARVAISGGGPAGLMAGLLLARAGVSVCVLEKHADFLRDFRGDTVHPSTQQVMQELGLLASFLARPHDEARTLEAVVSGQEVAIADFSGLAHPFIALMPQWEFLDFLHVQAAKLPGFRLERNAQADGLLMHPATGRVQGLRGHRRTAAGEPTGETFVVDADLVIAADGRDSRLRGEAGLSVQDIGAPIDVLWMRIPREPHDPSATGGRIEPGRFLAMINRGDYWQCAYVIRKGGMEEIRARGIEAFRAALQEVAPLFAGRLETALPDWEAVKLLSVTVDRLRQWWRPGFLAIGDAAHAMSPVGGVGINLAIQDAVATANLLAAALADASTGADAIDALLPGLQKRRLLPVRLTQAVQVAVQDRLLTPVLASGRLSTAETAGRKAFGLPWPLRLMNACRPLRRIPAWLVGAGIRPEHVRSPRKDPSDS